MFISFIKQEGRKVYGKLKSLKYKPSPIVSGDLEVPLLLKCESQDKWVTDTMEEFVENFHSFGFAGDLNESEINEKDEETDTSDDPITNETKEILVECWFTN